MESGFDVKRSGIFKELEKEFLHIRSCEVLFKLFLRAYPEMKLNWKDNRKNWTKKRGLTRKLSLRYDVEFLARAFRSS